MNNVLETTDIYQPRDFSEFILLLNRIKQDLMCDDIEFIELFYSMYSKLYDDTLLELGREVCSGIDIIEGESPSQRTNRFQRIKATAAAKSLFNQLDYGAEEGEEFRELFIYHIAYCLLCRFKFIPDPMDHQIREGILRRK